MAYRFGRHEAVRAGILRCADEQLDRAVDELTERIGEDSVDAVHSARKAIKQERSLLRLARGSMDSAQRRRENEALREAAGRLSSTRDAEVMVDTLDELSTRYVGQLPERTFQQIRERLAQRRDRERAQLAGSPAGRQAAEDLRAVRARQAKWKLSASGWTAIEPGLRRSYRDGRELCRRARSEPSFADWHTWRKRVKDLWYQERLLAHVAGPAIKGQVKELHHLADLLGDDHDLGVLRDTLQSEAMTPPVDLDAVVVLIDHRRGELQSEAVKVGGRIYFESPGRFTRRMRRSWQAGRAIARAAREQRPAELGNAVRRAA